ncbi:hypothetical protein HMI54_004201 [Coelomomyces lativittatus]|nr:hypothetical protein HMI56_001714 [Coelomomyces lativittatus]KAJ1517771.1 hypothetical protein HMI54_004201 [Coelomomyces lativittatus]KAJ1518435.1 hypothetical protein HMI55_002052 [Coelomomyces lativittatus]
MNESIDYTSHNLAYYSLNGLLVIVFFLTAAGTFLTRHYPCMNKRRIELNIAFTFIHLILSQRSLNTGFENWTSLRRNANPIILLIDILVFSTLVPVAAACVAFQLLILLNDANIAQQLLKGSTNNKGSVRRKRYLQNFDYKILSLFGIRRRVFQSGPKTKKYLDFSSSSIFRSIFILVTFFSAVSISFSVIFLNSMEWDTSKVSQNWFIVWLFVIAECSPYLGSVLYYVWKTRDINDSYFIWRENSWRAFLCVIFGTPPIFEAFITQFQSIRRIGINCMLSFFMYFFVTLPAPVLFCYYFLYSMKRRIKGLTATLESFNSMFVDKHMWSEFKKLLAKDLCMEGAYFLDEYDRILQQEKSDAFSILNIPQVIDFQGTGTLTPQSSRSIFLITCNNAMDLYNVFLNQNCVYELNVSFKAKQAITQLVAQGNLKIDDFRPIYIEVVNSMLTNSFPRFIRMKINNKI